MLSATLSLGEKFSGSARHKHASELHVITAEKLPSVSMNHLYSWLACQQRLQYHAISPTSYLGRGRLGGGGGEVRRWWGVDMRQTGAL